MDGVCRDLGGSDLSLLVSTAAVKKSSVPIQFDFDPFDYGSTVHTVHTLNDPSRVLVSAPETSEQLHAVLTTALVGPVPPMGYVLMLHDRDFELRTKITYPSEDVLPRAWRTSIRMFGGRVRGLLMFGHDVDMQMTDVEWHGHIVNVGGLLDMTDCEVHPGCVPREGPVLFNKEVACVGGCLMRVETSTCFESPSQDDGTYNMEVSGGRTTLIGALRRVVHGLAGRARIT